MNAKWLLEEDMFWDGNPDVLTPAIRELGMEVKHVKYVPFDTKPYEDFYDSSDCVVSYGSLNFITKLMREKPWVPGAWCNMKNMCCSTYYAHYWHHLLNHRHEFYPWKTFIRQCSLMENRDVHIRPDSGNKEFTGRVVSLSDAEEQVGKVSYGTVEPTTMVVVSPVRVIDAEYRFFIGGREVVSGCQYNRNGHHEEADGFPDGAYEKAKGIASEEWQPDTMYVADIAYSEGSFWLLEINSFSSAGFYACDARAIIEKASELAMSEWQDVQ